METRKLAGGALIAAAALCSAAFTPAALAGNAALDAAIGAGALGAVAGVAISQQHGGYGLRPQVQSAYAQPVQYGYAAPPAVYAPPQVVYAQPPAFYAQPQVVYAQPPVYLAPRAYRHYGYRGHRGWEHRHWR